ncbi:glycosyltransferase [Aquimarina agarilytica]|uniref:glycosyltransferase n=1 Tax=Aquimarina agarilytica TaxID=1087449 RepID=UPI000289B191|nr:glycosyltransferase [Aquimarina agarilytica]
MNGINVLGYIDGEFGLGEAVRRNLKALKTSIIPINEIDFNQVRSNENYNYTFDYSINLVQISLNDIDVFFSTINPAFFNDKYSILFLVWESEYVPEKLKKAINLFNEVWTPSTYCKYIFRKIYEGPIITVPHPVEVKLKPIQNHNSLIFFEEDKFSFLFIFNYHSSIERKNPFHLIEAFIGAFENDSNVELVIKTSGSRDYKSLEKRLHNSIRGNRNIKIIDIDLDRNSVDHLINNCDCYLSLHHSEGFGLTLAEAMYLGKPTLASNYSGNTEFMNQNNSYLVDCNIGEIENPDANFSSETIWGHPILEDTIEKLKLVYKNEELRKEKAILGEKEIKMRLSYKAVGTIMSNRLKHLYINFDELTVNNNHDAYLLNQLQIANTEVTHLQREIRRMKKNVIIKFVLFFKNGFRKLRKK